MKEAKENSYIAFISYRHKELDKKAAELIQKKIENYVIPKEFRESPDQKHFGRCFRDEDELPASASLSASIYEALDASRYLIVICTPDLPLSAWCRQEIDYFLKTHDRDHVIAVLADGTPAESFPEQLTHVFDDEGVVVSDCEPLAANIAGPDHTIDKKALKKESVRIFSALLGCPFDALWQRERRARTMRLLTASAAAMAVLAVFLIMALNSNAKINAQNRELARNMSRVLTDSGFTKMEKLEVEDAIRDGLSALESNDPEIYDHRAVKLLSDALGAYKTDKLRSRVVYEQRAEIEDLWVSADEEHVLLLDVAGTIHCVATEGFTEEWTAESGDPKSTIYAEFTDRILYKNRHELAALSLTDGSVLWRFRHDYFNRNYFQALSPDGSTFAVLDQTTEEETEGEKVACIRFFSTADGSQIGMTVLRIENYRPYILDVFSAAEYGAAFSEDGKALLAAIPSSRTMNDGTQENGVAIIKIELDTFEAMRVMGNVYMDFEGFYLSPDHDRLIYSALHPAGMLYMFNSPVPVKETSDVTYTYVGQNYHVPGGAKQSQNDYSSINRCKMLLYGESAMVFSDSTMYVFDVNTTDCRKNYPMSGKIVNGYWADQEEGIFEIICSDGWIMDYDLAPGGKAQDPNQGADACFSKFSGKSFQYSVKRSVPLGGSLIQEDEGSCLLSISEDNPGQLILTESATDQHGTQVKLSNSSKIHYSYELIPDSDMAVSLLSKEKQVVIFNSETGEEMTHFSYESGMYAYNLLPLDKERILIREDLCSPDGTKEQYGEPYYGTPDSEIKNPQYPSEHIVLADGSVMSTEICFNAGWMEKMDEEGIIPGTFPVWLDGKLIPASVDPASAVILAFDLKGMNSEETFAWAEQLTEKKFGANGLLVRYGTDLHPEGEKFVMAEEPRFSVFDAHAEKHVVMEDPYPASEGRKVVIGNQKPWFAVGYNEGQLCLFDTETAVCTVIADYAPTEILAFGFSEDDALLAVLRIGGEIDLYDTASWTLTCSVYSSMIHAQIRKDTETWNNELKLTHLDGDRLCISAFRGSDWRSQCVLLDVRRQTVLAEIEEVYLLDTEKKMIYAVGNKELYRFPIYSAEDLVSWAKEKVGESTAGE